jgi:hypothetical protein
MYVLLSTVWAIHKAELDDSSLEKEDREELQVEDRDDEDEEDRHPLGRGELQADGNDGTVELYSEAENEDEDDETVTVGGTVYTISAKRRRVSDEVEIWNEDGEEDDIKMGETETVTAGDDRWERIEAITEDHRKEPHFDMTFKTNLFHEDAMEVDIFRALDGQQLLHIVRENADEDGDKRVVLVGMTYRRNNSHSFLGSTI